MNRAWSIKGKHETNLVSDFPSATGDGNFPRLASINPSAAKCWWKVSRALAL